MLLVQKDQHHHHDVIFPLARITLGPSISLPCGTTLPFSYIGYAILTSFRAMDRQHPPSHGTFVPCMPYMRQALNRHNELNVARSLMRSDHGVSRL